MNQPELPDFDPILYSSTYADVAASGLTPVEHFNRFGFALGRDKYFHFKRVERINRSNADSTYEAVQLPLIAANQIDHVEEQRWRSSGDDPFFFVDIEKIETFSIGWYLFSVSIKGPRGTGVAKFFLDTGDGLNEHDVVVVPYTSGKRAERLFYIDKYVNAIRFDPLEQEGDFELLSTSIRYVSPSEATEIISSRLRKFSSDVEGIDFQNSFGIDQADILDARATGIPRNILDSYNYTFQADRMAYDQWIVEVEKATQPSEIHVLDELNSLSIRPIFSILMPVYNTPEGFLRSAIESVLRQSYPYWELCVADDCSSAEHVRKILAEYERKDPRIKSVIRTENGHISAASNSALTLSAGDFVVLLDHDDELAEHALLYVAKAISENPHAKILYSDEDKIDMLGRRFQPHFKSDWNPDLFFSQNYVSHLGVYERDLIKKLGGFRLGVEGSQDYDLFLRSLDFVSDSEIIHIPKILYHWRTIDGSTALEAGEKSYTQDAGLKALRDYFSDRGETAICIEPGLASNTYRVKWPIPAVEPLVSMLIPTRDKKDVTELAIRSILEKTTYGNYEIIIIDNGSVEVETLEFFSQIQAEDSRVRVIRYDFPFNYSAINNFGFAHAKGEIIGLINNDVEVISDEWLTEMVSHALRPEIGCVGAKLYYGNGTIQHGGVIIGLGGVAGHSHKHFSGSHAGYFNRLKVVQNLSAVTAACLLVRREIYSEVGGLNERDLMVAFNDVDFCLKVRRAGYRNLWTPYAELFHHESISRGSEDNPEKVARFRREIDYMKRNWAEWLRQDIYYNPNLSRDREDFSIGRL
ncbi:glycosyltransferase family 2 protein [Burkholderia multivorans]|uniref:glycosyltransferase family 2 protein n=1 Tax=Burkholderia multivorans TaxID=87883 RepID=UPI0021BE7B3B|nr:glycosyltransferase family 2 protein [Burkholderia multivorans]